MGPSHHRLGRNLHPGAWWLWALSLAAAASRTTNPLLLGLIVAVAAVVVSARRTEAPWAQGFRAYVVLGLVVVGIRVLFRVLIGGQTGEHILFRLPEVPLPEAAAGIRLGGPVSAEGVLAAVYDGLRLATLLLCVGAANVLANPRRLLKAVPAALHEVGVAVTVALSVAPQLVESAQRVRRARRLRGDPTGGRHLLREVAIPVFTDALERSMLLAAAMDTRGYGRRQAVTAGSRRLSTTLTLGGLIAVCLGTYGMLDRSAPGALGVPLLLVGAASGWLGMAQAGRRVSRSRYRPDPWRGAEWAVAASGLVAVAVVLAVGAADELALHTVVSPPSWPRLPVLPALAIVVAVLPAWLAPPPAPLAVRGVPLPARSTLGTHRSSGPTPAESPS